MTRNKNNRIAGLLVRIFGVAAGAYAVALLVMTLISLALLGAGVAVVILVARLCGVDI